MLNALVAKIAGPLARKIALTRIRDAAEGRLGPTWKARYWALAGAKRWIGFGLFILAVCLEALGERETALFAGVAATFLVTAGLVDKGWRSDIPDSVRESALYRGVARFSGELAALLATVAYFVSTGDCAGYDCAIVARGLAVVAAVLVQLGLVDAAWKSVPPIMRREDGKFVLTIEDPFGPRTLVASTRSELETVWHASTTE